ncbi:phosphate/phosphite/phosphonate ABC transporter substrate-binding protein [candidate division CSSED10-310 bacterium]|uniref:Phosphate/phosphite/phosphonate ABC transporter substrate-binding protein n=1 Tax=candidate division CSSED10-310 bacterium TaxID=2855610 RepID=A0ABV6YSE3_UNCC1
MKGQKGQPKMRLYLVVVWTVWLTIFSLPCSVFAETDLIRFCYYDPDNEANNPMVAVRAMQPFAEYVGDKIQKTITIHFFISRKHFDQYLNDHTVSLAIVSPYYYVENRELRNLVPLAVPFVNESVTYKLILVTANNAAYRSLPDLKNTRLVYNALVEENYSFLNRAVFLNRIDISQFFNQLLDVTTPLASINTVLDGKAECALIVTGLYNTLRELDPRIAKKTKTIFSSGIIPRPPVCYIKGNLAPDLARKIAEILFAMRHSTIGQQTLLPFKVDGFKPVELDPFLHLEKILKEVK